MTKPVRIQISRAKGFRLQAASRALNGLEAVHVARPSRWGNPWTVGGARKAGFAGTDAELAATVVAMFHKAMLCRLPAVGDAPDRLRDLRGKNLACWCALDAPCHADVLLELANAPVCEETTP